MTSLVGVPKKIKKDFDCSDCTSLKSLAGAPEHVGGNFYCDHCTSLNSLEGLPKKIGGNFYCNDCAVKFDRNEIINKCCISGYEITT